MENKLKKNILVLFLFALCLYGTYMCSLVIGLPLITEIYNTIYSTKFSENNFSKIKINDNKTTVRKLIGEPLKIIYTPYFDALLYTEFKAKITPFDSSPHLLNETNIQQYTLYLLFDETGSIVNITNNLFQYKMHLPLTEYNKIEKCIGKTKQEIKKEFGEIFQERVIPRGEIWYFSDIKKGGKAGKTDKIFIRRLFIINQNVVIIIRTNGSAYDAYIGF